MAVTCDDDGVFPLRRRFFVLGHHGLDLLPVKLRSDSVLVEEFLQNVEEKLPELLLPLLLLRLS